MEFAVRYSSSECSFPLPIAGPVCWTGAHVDVELGEVPAGHIIVPSFSQLSGGWQPFEFTLTADDLAPITLQRVPARDKKDKAHGGTDAGVSTHIDCWHTHRDLSGVIIRLSLLGQAVPTDATLTLSLRPLQMIVPSLRHTSVHVPQPLAISQMDAPAKIRQRICSPTAVAMCLADYLHGELRDTCWSNVINICLDPASGAYGSWPLAVKAANSYGVHCSIEAITDWRTVATVLAAGHPIVCSINFAKGELDAAPLEQTSGHLVVLYGFDDRHAWVMDPAAPDVDQVDKRYDLKQFAKAWLHQRGAAYIFSTDARSLPD